ncbi:hypothetical protein Pmani_002980 [Petrolisthes manimaculis]|uniref:Uncharacterized protein n=1 Tax=Petrolisthes manimaculis TaxID=1843537 RepID=A0AAE1QGF5_9EUCA|nr:hypothetical protein Pmani_002980 [Petrolisthes manimaculis]
MLVSDGSTQAIHYNPHLPPLTTSLTRTPPPPRYLHHYLDTPFSTSTSTYPSPSPPPLPPLPTTSTITSTPLPPSTTSTTCTFPRLYHHFKAPSSPPSITPSPASPTTT